MLCASLILNGVLYIALKVKESAVIEAVRNFDEFEMVQSRADAKIAVIDLFGIISYGVEGQAEMTMVDDVIAKLKQAREDADVKAIVLRVDSPGGEVNASDVLYNELRKTRDQYKKPIVTHMMSMGASGAYYAAMGSSFLMANDLTITGSVGVIMQSVQYAGLLDKVGMKIHTFKSGKFKDLLAGNREPTPEELQYVQDFVMETYDKFAGIVARERRFDLEELKSGLADGRILSGAQALRARFVDKLGYFEDAVNKAKELGGVKDAKVVHYRARFTFGRLFGAWGAALLGPRQVQVSLDPGAIRLEAGKAYFLPAHLLPR